jgi:hypothetical protein
MRTRTTTDVTSIRDTVVGEHAKNPHPELAQEHLRAHLLIHEIVEKQLAEGDPPEVGRVLHRLLANGLSRHEAIHAIGTVVAREALAMMKQGRPLDQEAYVRELQNLTVENYRRSVSSIGMGE